MKFLETQSVSMNLLQSKMLERIQILNRKNGLQNSLQDKMKVLETPSDRKNLLQSKKLEKILI
jgi:hypothetical protein